MISLNAQALGLGLVLPSCPPPPELSAARPALTQRALGTLKYQQSSDSQQMSSNVFAWFLASLTLKGRLTAHCPGTQPHSPITAPNASHSQAGPSRRMETRVPRSLTGPHEVLQPSSLRGHFEHNLPPCGSSLHVDPLIPPLPPTAATLSTANSHSQLLQSPSSVHRKGVPPSPALWGRTPCVSVKHDLGTLGLVLREQRWSASHLAGRTLPPQQRGCPAVGRGLCLVPDEP